MNISFHYKLKSHPDRLVKQHLIGVHQKALALFDSLKFDFPNFNREDLRKVISVTSLFHDFGKATSFFQNYIQNPKVESTEDSRKKRSHGLISALLTFGILKEELLDDLILPLFGLILVRRHHGDLMDFNSLIIFNEKDLENVLIQIDAIDYTEMKSIISECGFNSFVNRDFIIDTVSYFQPRTPRELKRLCRNFSIEYYFVMNLLYSILLQADKTDAILNDDKLIQSELLRSYDVHKFKNQLDNNVLNPIDIIRKTAFDEVENEIETITDNDRIFSINIPTGSGKTITSLNAALKLCEKFHHTHIVYCLPFTSIIDQNFDVFEKIRISANLPDDSSILLKHHHLTDIFYRSVSEENIWQEYSINKALHLIEGWESRITVTTFIQFIYSLISYKNSALRKFNRFSNAVIILDEIQSIPHEYWSLIKEMLSQTSILLNTKIILVTATMPLIFSEEKKEIIELVKNKQEMFRRLNRIELDVSNLSHEKMNWDEFCEKAFDLVKINQKKDILFVMNTIRSAKELYEFFNESISKYQLLYLSSHIIPKERIKRIDHIKSQGKDMPILIVSTQLIEAGVDIDLDIVVRDFAPLDNIFQTCGRCNRECRDSIKGQVILFSLKDSNSWAPSGIYKNFLKQKTLKVLKEKSIIQESEFFQLSHDYFNELKKDDSQAKSLNLLEKISKLKYQNDDEKIEMKLIDDDYSASVFVEIDDTAQGLWDNYMQIQEMDSGFDKMIALKKARRKLAEFIINIPKKCLPSDHDSGIYHLRKDRVSEYYGKEIGFKIDKVLPPEKSVFLL
ncbi:MAG: CRISPR-associated helicase Cas3' [Candidatus Cloacimonetes bacterium]|nr:CRISPR-associated helicase Cas3' [Candidatus Cloacimonadota bacterium]MCF7815177.1 CRISPR-associated helicase Cas3' [Candidatus Cloacimonadota bacterium]MCF7867695.1 CRISPR-associated helicase Cas3' [Candidatus Cloacimonadota bacterium]